MGFTIKAMSAHTWLEAEKKFSWMLSTQLSLVVFNDLCIATCLCNFLYRERKESMRQSTVSMINVLMLYAINTGLVTSAVMLTCLITLGALPNTLVFVGIYYTASKFYLNALLATLNVRKTIRSHNAEASVTLPTGARSGDIPLSLIPGRITVESETRTHVDAEDYKV
ncbi:hypothetical protein BD309DRAFT_230277 [Dichomitus squalens]|nr:hypothetical protein BD309DRAFT_230277 [Dichomitus squalens]